MRWHFFQIHKFGMVRIDQSHLPKVHCKQGSSDATLTLR